MFSNRPREDLHLTQKWLVEEKSLDDGTSQSDHGETAVDNFLGPALENLFRGHILQHASVNTKVSRFSFAVVFGKGGTFNSTDNEECLSVSGQANGADGTKDIRVGELFTREVDSSLLDKDTADGEHANTAVLEFCPTSILQVGLDIRTAVERNARKGLSMAVGAQQMSVKMYFTYRRMGSNPISPGMEPSSFSGRTKKGMDLDISSAFKETDPARWDYIHASSHKKDSNVSTTPPKTSALCFSTKFNKLLLT